MDTIRARGFTIVELLIVVVVIAILTASLQQAAKKVVAEFTMKSDTYPATLASVGINNSGDTCSQYC